MTKYGNFDSDAIALSNREKRNGNSMYDFDEWFLSHLPLKDGISILDLGCGSCRHLKKIQQRYNCELAGVDLNPCDDFDVKICSIDDYVPNKHYDVIMSSYAFYYSDNMIERMMFFKDFTDFMFICGFGAGSNNEINCIPAVQDFVNIEDVKKNHSKLETFRLKNKIIFNTKDEFCLWWRNHNSYDPNFIIDLEFPFYLSKNALGIKFLL